jgi:hypothetical protein
MMKDEVLCLDLEGKTKSNTERQSAKRFFASLNGKQETHGRRADSTALAEMGAANRQT